MTNPFKKTILFHAFFHSECTDDCLVGRAVRHYPSRRDLFVRAGDTLLFAIHPSSCVTLFWLDLVGNKVNPSTSKNHVCYVKIPVC